jgi:soluble lytic murein transglycosylase-like protein
MNCLKCFGGLLLAICAATSWAQTSTGRTRLESEYYVAAYAHHYRVPVPLVRAVVEHESNWRPCAISPKGAVGLMQLMPMTARNLRVSDRCNIDQNVSGGVRYLAWLIQKFHGDLRMASAAYYAGESIVSRRGLAYRNPDVVAYVSRMRATYLRFAQEKAEISETIQKRDIR